MKKPLFVALGLLLIQSSFAQINLNSSDLASPGDVIYNMSPPLSVSLPPAGPNQAYNFNVDSTGVQDTTYYVNPASTPFSSVITGANLASNAGGAYTYFEKSNAGFYLKGLAFPIPDIGLNLPFSSAPFNFSPKIPVMTFPATVGMNLKTQSTGRFEFPYDTTVVVNGISAQVTKVAIIATLKDTSIIDGYGTATFPSGEVPCLRNRQYQKMTFKIELYAAILIFPASWIPYAVGGLPEVTSISYLFWANGKKSPVASLSVDTLGNLVNASFQSDLLHITTGVGSLDNQKELQIFPNPATEQISWIGNKSFKNLNIFSTTGQSIFQGAIANGQSSVKLTGLPNGLYWAEFEETSGTKTRKRLNINR